MSLISCSECNREISDKAESCPHCGCPIEKYNNSNNKNELFSVKLLASRDKVKTIRILRVYHEYDLKTAKDIVDSAPVVIAKDLTKDEATRFAQPFYSNLIKIEIISNDGLINDPISINQPYCPTCNQANIQKITIGQKSNGGGMFRIFSRKVRNASECKNCGYKW